MPAAEEARRTPLTRERALSEAVALADAEGIDAVSMRNLAARLGVVPMALYKHVANKEDLLGGVVDVLIGEYAAPEPGLEWKEAVRARILSARDVLLRHPWARRVIETRAKRTPVVLGYMDSLAGMFMAGGLSADLTHHAMHVLGHRIWGFNPEAFEGPDALPVPEDPAERERMIQYVSQTYPNILAIAVATSGGAIGPDGPGCDEQYEFELGLDLILDAVERLHEAGWTSRRAPAGSP
ncbi:TetR/AcrR family transcriptional regulator [Microbacterium album]|uniref:TetR family transcriptional regulator n=1 Tax=Microbacterium album TaxID=2053191 RepID=A0A917MN96_9MICO|nr:TetR/AcrR family transcriptional regulator C-terminal domain-containing protein [Microbacterium album]GGH50945.1 TetR family transcriptional regulator [Microbacterium album]